MNTLSKVLAFQASELETQAVLIATRLGRELERQGKLICTAESCTGGAIARALTETGGSSAWFDSAYITYSNRAKMANLAVPASTLEAYGAVSEPVVLAMAQGAVQLSSCHFGVAVSGVAGPGGGSVDKPVGTVCFAWAMTHSGSSVTAQAQTLLIPGDRYEVRLRTVCYALLRAQELIQGFESGVSA